MTVSMTPRETGGRRAGWAWAAERSGPAGRAGGGPDGPAARRRFIAKYDELAG